MTKPFEDGLRDQLLELLAESHAAIRQREQTEFDRRVGSQANRLLLFGAGNLGRRALSLLRQSGQETLGFMDNNRALWGRNIDGVEVFSPAEAAQRFNPADVAIVVTIWCGEATDKMSGRLEPLRSLGFRHIALFGHLAWKYPDVFLPHYSLDLPSRALAEAARIVQAFDLFQDRRSRQIFVAHVRWRLHLDYDVLPDPVEQTIYFNHRLIRPCAREFLIDGGAFIGDTIESFLETFGADGFRRILSFEPDPNNFAKLERYLAALPAVVRSKIQASASALGEETSMTNVETSGGPSSRVGCGDHQVPCRRIDEFIDDESAPTFIKLDVEGYEPQALRGATETLKKARPVVTACVYHVQNHLWEIPLGLDKVASGYQYALVPHLSDGWDLVLYAVPAERRAES